jgi:hypothetical protein
VLLGLAVTAFKYLYAKYSAEKAELSNPTDNSSSNTEQSLRAADIDRQILHFFKMSSIPEEQASAMKIDLITFWQDNSARFPILISLALTMAAIPASSAASERLF